LRTFSLRDGHILQDRQVRKEVELLEDHAHFGTYGIDIRRLVF
jgi:hypothetical protein